MRGPLCFYREHNTSRVQCNPKIKISVAKRGSFLLVRCEVFLQYALNVLFLF